MRLLPRSVVSVLSGLGSGFLGYWAAWKAVEAFDSHPVEGYSTPVLVGGFAPFIATAVLVFFSLHGPEEKAQKAA
jgi:hypothetical protein